MSAVRSFTREPASISTDPSFWWSHPGDSHKTGTSIGPAACSGAVKAKAHISQSFGARRMQFLCGMGGAFECLARGHREAMAGQVPPYSGGSSSIAITSASSRPSRAG
jgi:hypothetical protein